MTEINLGRKMDEMCCPCPASSKDEKDRLYYPTLYLENAKLGDLPETGEITLKYRLTRDTSKTEYEKGEKVKKSHCADLEILSILSIEKSDEDQKPTSREDHLDKLAKDSTKETDSDDEGADEYED